MKPKFKYYKCKHFIINNNPPCSIVKFNLRNCPVITNNLRWLTLKNPNSICSYGLIEIDWIQYITKRDIIDKDFDKSNVLFTTILLFVYNMKDYFKSRKDYRANIDF